MNQDKLAKIQQLARAGGKGTPRRKQKKVTKSAGDDKKLQSALKKVGVQLIPPVEEVNMFKSDGNVIHFVTPKGKSCLMNFIVSFIK